MSASTNLRIAILGSGAMGRTHAASFAKTAGVTLAVIASRTPAKARALAKIHDARATADMDAVLRDPDIDAVSITLPTHLHRRYAVAALRAGKHVLLEKPFALNVRDCDAIIAAQRASRRTLMVAHVLRFWPEYVAIQARVASGALGAPISVVARRNASALGPKTWFRDPRQSGGAVLDLIVHDYDVANALLGAPKQASALGSRSATGTWDDIHATVAYPKGRHALIEGNQRLPAGYPFTMSLRVLCERGAIEFTARGAAGDAPESESTSLIEYTEGKSRPLSYASGSGYDAQTRHFVDCARAGRAPELGTPAQARAAVALANAVQRSLRTRGAGQPC
jgi:UDP-N-acetylglucosamine 3-dehydrogenase